MKAFIHAKLARVVVLSVLTAAAMGVFAAAPATAAPDPCPDGYLTIDIDPLDTADASLQPMDLNGDLRICVSLVDSKARTTDNSEMAAVLGVGLLGLDWVQVDVESPLVTLDDIVVIDQSQRGNRNNFVGANVCSQNTGNSCVSHNRIAQRIGGNVNVDILLFEDTTGVGL